MHSLIGSECAAVLGLVALRVPRTTECNTFIALLLLVVVVVVANSVTHYAYFKIIYATQSNHCVADISASHGR